MTALPGEPHGRYADSHPAEVAAALKRYMRRHWCPICDGSGSHGSGHVVIEGQEYIESLPCEARNGTGVA